MGSRKMNELRELNDKELNRMVKDLGEQMMNIRFKSRIERPTNIMEMREMKRQIARIKTILNERKRAQEVAE